MGACIETLIERLEKIMQQWMIMGNLISEGKTTKKPNERGDPASCWKCGEVGHIRRNCPEIQRGRDKQSGKLPGNFNSSRPESSLKRDAGVSNFESEGNWK